MADPDERFTRLVGLWLDAYEEIAKTLRHLPDPIVLPPVTRDIDMIERMVDAAAEASVILYDREESSGSDVYRFLAEALLFWLAAFDVIGWDQVAPDAAWRAEAVLLTLRQAAGQAVIAAEWLRSGPPMPPPMPYSPN